MSRVVKQIFFVQVAQHIPEKRHESIAPEQTLDLTQARSRFDPVECRRSGDQVELIVGQYDILKTGVYDTTVCR